MTGVQTCALPISGTSDIAITKEGSVIAYGMIPIAGDEITEKIAHTYLVDFKTAENIKQRLSDNNMVVFSDIIGIPHEVPVKDVIAVIEEEIDQLASEIARKITELNGEKSPNAIFCVGGGSQTPHMTQILADKLSVPLERVAIRSSEHAVAVIDEKKQVQGPESITPLGICLTTMEKKTNDFIGVKVNNKRVKLLHTRVLTVADAAIAIGLDHTQIISVRGKTLMFKLNGERTRIKGEAGSQPRIVCNNKEVTLDESISEGDELTIYPAQNGEGGQVSIVELVDELGLADKRVEVTANGKIIDLTYKIQTGDDIIIKAQTEPLLDALEDHEKPDNEAQQPNQESAEAQEKVIHVTVNEQAIAIPWKENLVFVTVFDFIDFDLSSPKGNIVLKLNGKRASYTDILTDGDQIDIYWDETII